MVAAAVGRKIVAGGGQFAGNAHNLGRPTGAPWKQCHLWFFSVWLGLNAILHFSDTTPQAAAVGADISAFDSFDILMRLRCLEERSCLPLLGLLPGGQTRLFCWKRWKLIRDLSLRTTSFAWNSTRVSR